MTENHQLQMCFARLADVMIAFDSSMVARFTDSAEFSKPADIDAASALDIDLGSDLLTRRWAILDHSSRTLSVALGTHLQLSAITRSRILPLPQFVRDVKGLVGLLGIVRWQERFAFVVDLYKLAGATGALPDT